VNFRDRRTLTFEGSLRDLKQKNINQVKRVQMPNKKDVDNARKNRLELIAAGLSRRELFKMGLLTGAGYLVAKNGLSSRAWGFDKGKGGGGGDHEERRVLEDE